MRARWLALGLLLGLASIATAQGGVGFFMSPSCASIANPVTGQTVCWQSTAPNSFFFWDGAAFVSPTLGGPYAPSSFSSGFVLIGGGTGPITATNTPSVSGLTTTGQAALVVSPFNTATGNTGEVRWLELAAGGVNYVGFKASDAIAANVVWTLPNVDGANGTCLATNGAGVLSWGTCSAGSGTGITSLNGLNAAVQTVTNDTNVTLVSAVATHTLTWTGTLAVARGGTGVATLASNGVLIGNGTSAVVVTAAGAADTVLRVPGAGGTPAFGAVDVSKAAAITGLVRTANLGSGTANATTFLRGDQTWAAASGVPVYNFVFNSNMEVWGSGTSAAPTGWTVTGGTPAARNTTAGQFKVGTASVSITRTAGTIGIVQVVSATYPPIEFWQNQGVTCGAWVRATVASTTFIRLDDTVGQADSAFHSGGGAFEFLTATRTISNLATNWSIQLVVSTTNTTSQFDGAICVLGSSVANWQPSGYLGRKATLTFNTGASTLAPGLNQAFGFYGPVTVGNAIQVSIPLPFRAVARNLSGLVSTAPGGADTITTSLRVNEAVTTPSLAFSIGAAAIQASDTTNELLIAKGSRLFIRALTSATAAASQMVTTVELEEVPEGI